MTLIDIPIKKSSHRAVSHPVSYHDLYDRLLAEDSAVDRIAYDHSVLRLRNPSAVTNFLGAGNIPDQKYATGR